MSRLRRLLSLSPLPALALSLAAALFSSSPASAFHRESYSMEILLDGRPLREYDARGTTYVEAREDREYSIRLTNHTWERVAIALSVDGLNSIDAKTTSARGASKWILGPYESITLDGWQTSSSTARRFFFTTERDSYGAWLGKTKNLGVIAAAVFREKRPVPVPIYRGWRDEPAPYPEPDQERAEAPSAKAQPRGAEDSKASSGSAREIRSNEEGRAKKDSLSDDLAATGIGREMGHEVRRVFFDAEDSPAARLEVRYEYRDALVRLGVLPERWSRWEDPLARRERARGFEDTGFAPDPYRRRR